MPRAIPQSDVADTARDPQAGQWQALRGELVALLDKVESRYTPVEDDAAEPEVTGLSRRMRELRNQVDAPESSLRRKEALRTVKRAVDRFSERDLRGEDDALTAAIAEIRSRQGAQPHPARRSTDMPELRDLGLLVTGMTQRLETLEGELKSQNSRTGDVRDVASQVEQLTQVVELLAGAIGETGQVKRLESQIAALATMVEEGPRNNLQVINARLDDVSATVGKLAELQAQQMEREIVREERHRAISPESMAKIAPSVQSIEASVRSVYDRIDAIERTVALSSGDFERLTSEMADFTQAMRDNASAPDKLVGRVEALAQRLEEFDGGVEVAALKGDIAALRNSVLQGIEPRFVKLEGKIEALGERIVPVDTSKVESQLSLLMARMDDAGAQLDGLARIYASNEDKPDFEQLATMVAERTSDAVSRKAQPPVALFGPESLKSIEDRIGGLIKSVNKGPNVDVLAELVAERTSAALAKSATNGKEDKVELQALERRMAALFNTAGKDTAERLTRLEAMLATREEAPSPVPAQTAPVEARVILPEPVAPVAKDEIVLETPAPKPETQKLDTILASLSKAPADAMPTNPADEAPLVDRGPQPNAPQRSETARTAPSVAAGEKKHTPPQIDPETVQRPPRPQSSFGAQETAPFVEQPKVVAPQPEPVAAPSSTSTFVAAARRAQRVRQDEAVVGGTSLIGRALAKVRQGKVAETDTGPTPAAVVTPPKAEKPVKPKREPKPAPERTLREPGLETKDGVEQVSFITKHRRPLLLAATLAAVSMLALNLILQRMEPAAEAQPTIVQETTAPEAPADIGEVSSTVPPRVIDLIDPTSTGSINPGRPMSFSAPADRVAPTPLPPTLSTEGTAIKLAPASLGSGAPVTSPDITGSIGPRPVTSQGVAEPFALADEAVGPLELREAAANGSAKAQFEVAAILGEGRTIEKDLETAAVWYERSAAQGFVPAQYRLGNLFELGSGVEKDLEQAKVWYQRSAEAGNRMAMHNLAALLAGGEIGEQAFEEASQWFARAAGHGMTDSQFNLGMLYARGLGVEQDFEQSFKWFSLAAISGDKDAGQARDDIAKSLTAEAVSRVNAEVKDWKATPVDLAANFAPIGTWTDKFDPGQAITSRDVVIKVQQALGKLGFDVGTPDGVAGPKTREAINAFERGTGMSESGMVNPRLLAVLGSQPV